jgi:hypothetical protein
MSYRFDLNIQIFQYEKININDTAALLRGGGELLSMTRPFVILFGLIFTMPTHTDIYIYIPRSLVSSWWWCFIIVACIVHQYMVYFHIFHAYFSCMMVRTC